MDLAGWYLALLLSRPIQSSEVSLVERHHTHFSITDDDKPGIEALGIVELSDRFSVIFGAERVPARNLMGEDGKRTFHIGSEVRAKLGVVIAF